MSRSLFLLLWLTVFLAPGAGSRLMWYLWRDVSQWQNGAIALSLLAAGAVDLSIGLATLSSPRWHLVWAALCAAAAVMHLARLQSLANPMQLNAPEDSFALRLALAAAALVAIGAAVVMRYQGNGWMWATAGAPNCSLTVLDGSGLRKHVVITIADPNASASSTNSVENSVNGSSNTNPNTTTTAASATAAPAKVPKTAKGKRLAAAAAAAAAAALPQVPAGFTLLPPPPLPPFWSHLPTLSGIAALAVAALLLFPALPAEQYHFGVGPECNGHVVPTLLLAVFALGVVVAVLTLGCWRGVRARFLTHAMLVVRHTREADTAAAAAAAAQAAHDDDGEGTGGGNTRRRGGGKAGKGGAKGKKGSAASVKKGGQGSKPAAARISAHSINGINSSARSSEASQGSVSTGTHAGVLTAGVSAGSAAEAKVLSRWDYSYDDDRFLLSDAFLTEHHGRSEFLSFLWCQGSKRARKANRGLLLTASGSEALEVIALPSRPQRRSTALASAVLRRYGKCGMLCAFLRFSTVFCCGFTYFACCVTVGGACVRGGGPCCRADASRFGADGDEGTEDGALVGGDDEGAEARRGLNNNAAGRYNDDLFDNDDESNDDDDDDEDDEDEDKEDDETDVEVGSSGAVNNAADGDSDAGTSGTKGADKKGKGAAKGRGGKSKGSSKGGALELAALRVFSTGNADSEDEDDRNNNDDDDDDQDDGLGQTQHAVAANDGFDAMFGTGVFEI